MARPKQPKADEQDGKRVQLSTKVSTEVYAMVVARAKSEDRSTAYIVRRFVLDGLGLQNKSAR
jgi:hypothetical protein